MAVQFCIFYFKLLQFCTFDPKGRQFKAGKSSPRAGVAEKITGRQHLIYKTEMAGLLNYVIWRRYRFRRSGHGPLLRPG